MLGKILKGKLKIL